ncbi:MAG TPA: hypothetical protein VLR49_04825 [Ferruginibacter sp.]|nr:hypothetical protein [Ferruginibacter sp.]
MEDRFSKYFHLTFNLFFTFLGFILSLLVLMLGLKYMFRLLDYIPWFVYVYMLFIIIVPASLFISIFVIYLKRTVSHPSAGVRAVSNSIFVLALILWAAAFVMDMITFFKNGSREISNYYSYNIFLLTGSVATIFLIGVLQALSTVKEKDWIEKRKERGLES